MHALSVGLKVLFLGGFYVGFLVASLVVSCSFLWVPSAEMAYLCASESRL